MTIGHDTHHHLVPDFYADAMKEAGITKVSGLAFPKWEPATSLRMMDKVGIEKALLSISSPGVDPAREPVEMARRLNELMAELRVKYPDRFGGFAAIPLCDPAAAVAEAVYALDSLGLEGIGLLSNSGGHYLGDPRFGDLMAELDARAARVFIHPNDPEEPFADGLVLTFYAWPLDTSRTVASLEAAGVFERLPDITFFLSHGGGALPAIAEIVKRRAQLMADTAKVADEIPLESVVETFGKDRITFGGDFPWAKKARYWKTQIEKSWANRDELMESVFETNARTTFSRAKERVA